MVVAALVVTVVVAGIVVVKRAIDGFGGDHVPGSRSQRLAVTVTPRTRVKPDQVVRVRSDAFEPKSIVGIAQCLPAVDTENAGEAACDTDGGRRFVVGNDGRFSASFPVRRIITVQGKAYDCAKVVRGCFVVAADARDFDRSGGQRITFVGGLPPVALVPSHGRVTSLRLPVTVDASPPFKAGQKVKVRAEGFVPSEPLMAAWCTDRLIADGPTQSCKPVSTQEAFTAVFGGTLEGFELHADEKGRVVTTMEILASVKPFVGETATPCSGRNHCYLVIAAAADTQRSAIFEYSTAR
ncbi:MAG: hypothetical protein KDB02_06170 [Acidimicrobiales bacterium]|nr:hypothetical protein [Acidimicrobiales bacterium]